MTDLDVPRRTSAWHHRRFDRLVAPDALRATVLDIPATTARTRGHVADPRRVSRPLQLLLAAALIVAAMGGAMAIGRLIAVPTPDEVPVNFAGLNPCDVLGFRPSLMDEPFRGTSELSGDLEHSGVVTSREFAAIRRGEPLRTAGPAGRCDYASADRIRNASALRYRGFVVEFRSQETTLAEAREIVGDPRYVTPPTDVAGIGDAVLWCRSRSAASSHCEILFVSAEPYFFVVSVGSTPDDEAPIPLRTIAASVLEALRNTR